VRLVCQIDLTWLTCLILLVAEHDTQPLLQVAVEAGRIKSFS
jgi:hypothetical protein